MKPKLDNVRARILKLMPTPGEIKNAFPMTDRSFETVFEGRQRVERILSGEDKRLLVIMGPCSIHNIESAIEYAKRVARLRKDLSSKIELVMRVYFEKPRTTIGWKGLINDPYLNGTLCIDEGVALARKTLLAIAELGVPAATEFLDNLIATYFADLVTFGAIGARTTESQTHREMASGLSMPVGFKNGTEGNVQIAIDAIRAARARHGFLGTNEGGRICIIDADGNPTGCVIVRGGMQGKKYFPNYSAQHINEARARLDSAGLSDTNLLVDISHANAEGDYRRQSDVLRDVISQLIGGQNRIAGVMIESHLAAGKQSFDASPLRLDQSITDPCLGWKESEGLMHEMFLALP